MEGAKNQKRRRVSKSVPTPPLEETPSPEKSEPEEEEEEEIQEEEEEKKEEAKKPKKRYRKRRFSKAPRRAVHEKRAQEKLKAVEAERNDRLPALAEGEDRPLAICVNDICCGVTVGLLDAGYEVAAVIPKNAEKLVPLVNPRGKLMYDVLSLDGLMNGEFRERSLMLMTYTVTLNTTMLTMYKTELVEISAFVAVASVFRSRYICFICAKRMLSADGGRIMLDIFSVMKHSGYAISMQAYDLPRYGVPTDTTRVMITGKLCIPGETTRLHHDGWLAPCPPTTYPQVATVRSALYDADRVAYHDTASENVDHLPFTENQKELVEMVPMGKTSEVLPTPLVQSITGLEISRGSLRHMMRRLHTDEPAPSLLRDPCSFSRSLAHFEKDRPVSVPEVQKLMTFKAMDLLNVYDISECYSVMIGMVPPHFITVFFAHLLQEHKKQRCAERLFPEPEEDNDVSLEPDLTRLSVIQCEEDAAMSKTCSSVVDGSLSSWRENRLRVLCYNGALPKTARGIPRRRPAVVKPRVRKGPEPVRAMAPPKKPPAAPKPRVRAATAAVLPRPVASPERPRHHPSAQVAGKRKAEAVHSIKKKHGYSESEEEEESE